MFAESFLSKGGGRPPRDRLIGVLVTVLFHGLLGLLVYHGRFTVKILPFDESREEVRDVVIVPPLKISIPKVVGGRDLTTDPLQTLGEEESPVGARQTPAPPQEPPAETGGATTGEAGAGETGPPPGAGAVIPSLSSRFQQSLTIRGRSALTIPLAPPGTPAGPPGLSVRAPLPDFSKYGRGATGGGGYGTGRGGTGTGGGRQRIGVSIPFKGYDLLPWASVVIERLQLHWELPAVTALPETARISFVVVIKKSGELNSIEILEGTTVEALDRAALEAIQAVLPFPALPDDFPGDLLEMTLEFVYND
jgi:TonB family protein